MTTPPPPRTARWKSADFLVGFALLGVTVLAIIWAYAEIHSP